MKLKDRFLNLLFPEGATCEICGKEIFDGGRFCRECKKTVVFNDGATCPLCGRKTANPVLCLECKDDAPPYKKAVSALSYEGGAKKLIYKFKGGSAYLKEYFADLIAPKCLSISDADCICFIPTTKKVERKRGYNQAEILAYSLSERLNLPVLRGALVKKKETPQQKALSKRERAENLAGCFMAYKDKVAGKTIILVDDVMTTGATASAACSALMKKGARAVYFATVASVTYKRTL